MVRSWAVGFTSSRASRAIESLIERVMGTQRVDLDAAGSRLAARRELEPPAANVELALDTLHRTLDRVLEGKHKLDAKAALVVPAIGVIGGLVAERAAAQPPEFARLLAALAIVLAMASIAYAIGAIRAGSHVLGPEPVDLATSTGELDLRYSHQIANALAIAVLHGSALVATKGTRFNRSLSLAGAALVPLLGFVALGGWE